MSGSVKYDSEDTPYNIPHFNSAKYDTSENGFSGTYYNFQRGCTPPGSTFSLPVNENKIKTIVLDLDNTLVRASFQSIPQYDFTITVPGMGECNDTLSYYVQKRPGVDLLLQRLTEYNYEIVAFTSSHNAYADAILNKLEKDNNIAIDFRLYKDSCTMMLIEDEKNTEEREDRFAVVKDLVRLARDLNNVIIVDDDPAGYTFQPKNAVPVKVFNGDLTDRDLWKVMDLCKVAATCGDVREAIRTHAFVSNINEKYACSLRRRQRERERHLCGVNLSRKKKTIALEIFDVLISITQSPYEPYDFVISVIEAEETVPMYVAIRPGVGHLLSELRKNYEIVIFTESHHEIADVILGKIDVNFDISRRFYRDHCKKLGDGYVKDLKKIGLDLCNVMIVDRNPSAYKYQPENGICLIRFESDVNDRELYKLVDFCNVAVTYEDLRRAISLNRASNNVGKESPALRDGSLSLSAKRKFSFF